MHSTDTNSDILIIGAGVAGLVLAQGLKHRNVPFKLFERDSGIASKSQGYRFRAIDVAINARERTLSPDMWNLLEKTHPLGSRPNLMLLDAISGKTLRTTSTEGTMSWPIDRPWFRELLSVGIEQSIHFDKGFESYELLDGHRVRVKFADGTSAAGRMLIAADGVRSLVRKQMFPYFRHLDVERMVIWGRTPLNADFERRFARPDILAEHFAAMIDTADTRRSCLFAPIRWPNDGDIEALSDGKLKIPKQDDYMFCAFCGERAPEGTDLSTQEGRKKYCLEIAKTWNSQLRTLIEDLDSTYAIPVYSCPPDVPKWETDIRITFMGDAIHTMAPTGGVGGNTAIADAAALCKVIADASKEGYEGEAFRMSLEAYEDSMRKQAKRAIESSFAGGKMLWQGKDWPEYEEVKD
jgi:2-polyprenyl-6-methoxyphenol hydroxylase-like FAD-dependent oxidoreductase